MAVNNLIQPLRVSFIATYPPRRCGIATFTSDLLNGLKSLYGDEPDGKEQEMMQVIALNDTDASPGYAYSRDVSFEIRWQHRDDYRRAADFINLSSTDVVSLQHEFGIFGGEDGSDIIHLLRRLKKPLVTTMHTILEKPTAGQQETMEQICRLSASVVVQTKKAVKMLQDGCGLPGEKVVMIDHGTPDVPFLDSFYYKEQLQAEGKKVLLTFGLLGPNKGIEYVIEALPDVVSDFPDLLFIVLGATHPGIRARYGEDYRNMLEKMVKDKGLTGNVTFCNQYVSIEELLQFLEATDIYISPYINKEQIVSGTLAYALACGKAIISTPYWHAEELLSGGRGCLVPFCDSKAIAEALTTLLKNETMRNQMRKKSYQLGRRMIWSEVAMVYLQTFERALFNYRDLFALPVRAGGAPGGSAVPEISLSQMYNLTDDTGICQHAVFTVPNRVHGYCTDDNARALIVAVMNWQLFRDTKILTLVNLHLSFLAYALNEEKGRVRNFMSFDRRWLEEAGSEDSHGRAVWALGYTVAYPPAKPMLSVASSFFKQVAGVALSFESPRSWAYSIFGSLHYLRHFGGDTEVRYITKTLSRRLLELYEENAAEDWLWFENILTYDNARLPQAIIAAGQYFSDTEMLDSGLKALEWLISVQTDPIDGHLSLVGNEGWYKRGAKKSRFDQQPIDAAALVDACYQAFLATQQQYWLKKMGWSFNWFLGNNDVHQPICNFTTGGCYDGLEPGGVNQNQGAESTVSFLMALHKMHLATK